MLALLTEKQRALQKLLPLPKIQEQSLEEWFRVELTYSSNAIEGNTLTRIESAEIIEKGVNVTISGKSLKEQLEALNHAKAVDFVKDLVKEYKKNNKTYQNITEEDIKQIHRLVLTGIDDEAAGKYRSSDVYLKGRDIALPSPARVLYLMADLIGWLSYEKDIHPVRLAADAHFKFVSIHPFVDGNGRTGRLLMNLILQLCDYPMTIIRKEDRQEYLDVLYTGQKSGEMQPYYTFMEQAVDRSLDVYLHAASGKPVALAMRNPQEHKKPLRVGDLAKKAGVSEHTIRYWTKEGLLAVKETTKGGYKLYDPFQIEVIEEIKRMQKQRHTLSEIKKAINKQF